MTSSRAPRIVRALASVANILLLATGVSGAEPPTRITAPALKLETVDFNHPPREYVRRTLSGWTVLVEKQLADDAPELAKRATARLEQKLARADRLLPAASLGDLRKVKFFLMYGPKADGGGRDNGLEYFQRHAPEHFDHLDPRMAGSIVVYDAENYVRLTEFWAMKAILHELGHAQHLEHWPESHAEIYDTWKHAVDTGLYQTVLPGDRDAHLPNYAAQNHLEYFAELTAMYFLGCDYTPRDRAALKQYDPAGYQLIEKLWGIPDPGSLTPDP